jgi:hypothetical protein
LGPQRSQRSSEASSTIHCTSSSKVVPTKALRVPARMTSRSPGRVITTRPLMRSSKRKTRTRARPGSQAPYAPPALTFGLTGKQSVKPVLKRCVLMRLMRSLAPNRRILADSRPSRPEIRPPGMTARTGR